MKKHLYLLLLAVITCQFSFAQSTEEPPSESYDKNVFKVNLTGLPLRNFGFQYERMLSRKSSFNLGLRFMPKGSIPMLSSFETTIDDPTAYSTLSAASINGFAITPEFRVYLGKKGGPRGFYLAPFARYTTFDASLPTVEFTYEVTENNQTFTETRTIDMSGSLSGITGGLMLGSQWRLGKSVYLDWWIIGGSFGKSSGELIGVSQLSVDEQDGLREELQTLDIPFVDYTVEVNSSGAKLNFDGPFASLRGGLSLGIKF